jgi:hypothetical protein
MKNNSSRDEMYVREKQQDTLGQIIEQQDTVG